jgi:hypothetical protein
LFESLFHSGPFITCLTFAACADISEIQQGPEQENLKAKFFRRLRTFSHVHPYFVKQSLSMTDGLFNICIESATDSSGKFNPCRLEGLLRTLLRLTEEKQNLFLERKTQYQYLSFYNVLYSLSMSDDQFNLCIKCASDDSGKISEWDLRALLDLTEDKRAVFFRRKTQYQYLSFYNVFYSLSMPDNQFNRRALNLLQRA